MFIYVASITTLTMMITYLER